jgi:mono/diheme cytochrome c family protein
MRNSIIFGAVLFLGSTVAFADDAATERTWKAKCGSCHGNDGKAQTEKGKKDNIADITTAEFQKKVTDAQIKEAIEKGVTKEEGGKKKHMDAYAGKLKPEQIDDLVKYVRKLGGK